MQQSEFQMLVSVIIPFYNSEKYIAASIDSVLKQTHSDFEIICVNNNSADRTEEIVTSFVTAYPNKINLIHESRKGANYARNTGMHHCNGQFIQFLDADDELYTSKFEEQLKGFDESDVNIVVSDRVIMDEKLSVELEHHDYRDIERTPLNTVISKIVITGNPLYRKSFLEAIGGWNETLPNAQDWELNIRAVLKGAEIKYIPMNGLKCRRVSDSLSSNWKSVSDTSCRIITENWDEIKSFKEQLSWDSWRKLFFIFYLSAKNAEREMRKARIQFIEENIAGYSEFISNPVKKVIIKLGGLNALIYFENSIGK